MYVSICRCLYVCVKKISRTDSSELTVEPLYQPRSRRHGSGKPLRPFHELVKILSQTQFKDIVTNSKDIVTNSQDIVTNSKDLVTKGTC